MTLMSGAMLAPGLEVIGQDLKISEAEASLALPILLALCSEVFSRRPIWIVGSAWYILWNTLCRLSGNQDLMIVGRLMSGLGASAKFVVSNMPF